MSVALIPAAYPDRFLPLVVFLLRQPEWRLLYTDGTQTLFAYDPKTDSWTNKAEMQTARRFVAACAVDGIIYAIGGGGLLSPPTDAVEAYDPKTDTWMTKAKLSSPRFTVSVCAVDGIIYAIGGATGATFSDIQALTKVEAYNPKTDQWTPKAPLPTPVLWPSRRQPLTPRDGRVFLISCI